jgi:cupin fold WbuC family metalloprotein
MENLIPNLSDAELTEGLRNATSSNRRRHPLLLHKPGSDFNRVFNFTMEDSYMQPHLHPGDEKIEEIHIVHGKTAVLYFDYVGRVKEATLLEKGKTESIRVPAFCWHTYVMLSDTVVTYETMAGIYDPQTWKHFAEWAPLENTPEAIEYLSFLKQEAKRLLNLK